MAKVVRSDDETFLVLAPTGRDAALTAALLAKVGLRCIVCHSLAELSDRVVREGAAGVLLTSEVCQPTALAALIAVLRRQEPWSDLPIIVFSSDAAARGRRQSNEWLMESLGNLTLLDRPLRPITMIRAARAALRGRRRQYAARAELQRQRMEVRQRDQFLAMLGHELRNPLGTISMAVEMMERSNAESPKHRGVIQRQATHLTRLVDDLLDVSRVTTGKIVLQRKAINLVDLVRRCLVSVEAPAQLRSLRVSMTSALDEVVAFGDPVRLEQVFVNLLTNAIKYTPVGGGVEVGIRIEGPESLVLVEDSGIGISAEMMPHIFDLFAQADGSIDRAQGGMGIGLTLVRSLVALHGGTVEASSHGLGTGSTFTVRLPLFSSQSAAAGGMRSGVIAPAARTREILIVEDNPDSRELLKEFLEALGHRVEACGDGLTAVERAVVTRPQVVMVDIGLPGLDGYGVARQLRSALGRSVFLIALTGYGQPEDRRRAFEAGFDRHLTKPIDVLVMEELLA